MFVRFINNVLKSIILIMFIIIAVVITCTTKVLISVAYKLQDLCTTYRQMLCATLKISRLLFQKILMEKLH